MELKRMIFTTFLFGFFLSTPIGAKPALESICTQKPNKPVHRVCGIVIDQSGATVAGARLTVLADEKAFIVTESDSDGKFSFDGLKAGSYDVQAEKPGFRTFQFRVVLVKPNARCEPAMEVELIVGGEGCAGVVLVKPKDVERRLHAGS